MSLLLQTSLAIWHLSSHLLLPVQILCACVFLSLYVVCEPGQRVMVIGGGLTSAHVISVALQQGASHVTWVMRKHLQV